MIEVIYYRKYHRVTVTGHAHSGESGHDLVCASASALVYTLAGNIGTLYTQESVRSPIIKLQEGDAELSCVPITRMKSVATLIFDTVCTGFELLQTYYPENLTYEVRQ